MSNDLVKRMRDTGEGDIYLAPTSTKKMIDEAADRIETLEAALKAAYASCREEVEKIKTDPYTELAKNQVIQYSSTTARDWMIAMADDIDRAIQVRAALEGKDA